MLISKQILGGIGLTAGALTTISFVPQLIAVVRLKSARSLSYLYLFAFALGILMWLLYGALLHDIPIIVANAVTLSLVVAIVICKMIYD